MQTVASLEKARNVVRRASGTSGQTTTASWTRPPIHRHAAERWAQSAISDFHEEPRSTAEWPDNERPETKPSPRTNAGQRRTVRSVSQARKRNAVASANPSVMATQ